MAHYLRDRSLSRRTVLRGALGGGLATVGLPLLEAMLNANATAHADGTDLPTRFMTWFFGNGVRLNRFEPAATGPDWALSEELAPLAPVKDYVSVLTGMNNLCEEIITHHEGMTVFNGYTMVEVSGLFSKAGGPTIDQLIADVVGDCTPVGSVHMGVSRKLSVMDAGTTLYALSHRGPNEPNYPEFDPREVWRQLFSEFEPKPDDRALRRSILDAVKDDVDQLKPELGTADNQRLEAHLEGIRSLEQKIDATMPSCDIPATPTEDNSEVNGEEQMRAVNDVMNDLVAYAFTCDITRVATMLFTGGAAETVFAQEVNQTTAHHTNTHNPGAQDSVHDAVLFIMERFTDLLTRLEVEVDPDGNNLLDTSIIYCSSDCSEGLSHSVVRQPIILAGHGRNKLVNPGIHHQQAGQNTSDALLACLQAFDPSATEIGAGAPMSTTPLAAIVA